MYNTLKHFKPMAENLRTFKNTTEAVDYYRETGDCRVICYLFINQYGHLKNISKKYTKLTDDEKASFVVEEIEKALNHYDASKGAQIQTLISTYVYRRLYAENKMREHQKRKVDYDNEITSSYEVYIENNVEKGMRDYYESELTNYLETMDLTDNELEYCKIVSSEKSGLSDSDVAKMMGVTPAAINYIKKKLKTKLVPMMA